jgi:Skp family chaperone for outer membrane proteins
MKRISTIAVSFIFAAIFAVSAFGQAAAPAGKIGWIDTAAFGGDEKGVGGVTRYVNAIKALDTEFQPTITELRNLDTKIKTLAEEIQKMQQNTAVPVKPEAIIAKQEEGQRLQRQLEFKQKDAEATLNNRRAQVLGPITSEIGKAIGEYAKQKGYAVVLDIAALANANALLMLEPSVDITKDFIAFFNSRASTTATAAPR